MRQEINNSENSFDKGFAKGQHHKGFPMISSPTTTAGSSDNDDESSSNTTDKKNGIFTNVEETETRRHHHRRNPITSVPVKRQGDISLNVKNDNLSNDKNNNDHLTSNDSNGIFSSKNNNNSHNLMGKIDERNRGNIKGFKTEIIDIEEECVKAKAAENNNITRNKTAKQPIKRKKANLEQLLSRVVAKKHKVEQVNVVRELNVEDKNKRAMSSPLEENDHHTASRHQEKQIIHHEIAKGIKTEPEEHDVSHCQNEERRELELVEEERIHRITLPYGAIKTEEDSFIRERYRNNDRSSNTGLRRSKRYEHHGEMIEAEDRLLRNTTGDVRPKYGGLEHFRTADMSDDSDRYSKRHENEVYDRHRYEHERLLHETARRSARNIHQMPSESPPEQYSPSVSIHDSSPSRHVISSYDSYRNQQDSRQRNHRTRQHQRPEYDDVITTDRSSTRNDVISKEKRTTRNRSRFVPYTQTLECNVAENNTSPSSRKHAIREVDHFDHERLMTSPRHDENRSAVTNDRKQKQTPTTKVIRPTARRLSPPTRYFFPPPPSTAYFTARLRSGEEGLLAQSSSFTNAHSGVSLESLGKSDNEECSVDGSPCESLNKRQEITNARYSKLSNSQLQRRLVANARERSRVHALSNAFDSLRESIPSYSSEQKLSKLTILRVAINYIDALTQLLAPKTPDTEDRFERCVEECTAVLQNEYGRTRTR